MKGTGRKQDETGGTHCPKGKEGHTPLTAACVRREEAAQHTHTQSETTNTQQIHRSGHAHSHTGGMQLPQVTRMGGQEQRQTQTTKAEAAPRIKGAQQAHNWSRHTRTHRLRWLCGARGVFAWVHFIEFRGQFPVLGQQRVVLLFLHLHLLLQVAQTLCQRSSLHTDTHSHTQTHADTETHTG